MSDEDGSDEGDRTAVVLDFLPRGRSDDDRPQYQKSPLIHALDVEDFGLLECALESGASLTIGTRVAVDPPGEPLEEVRRIEYDDLSGGARSELEYAVEDLVDEREGRFVEFFNEAGPITLRLHQLNLLPGIGDKLRDNVLEERERGPFEDLEDLEERVSGLHDPRATLAERILEEIRDEDVKYKLFARDPEQ